MTLLVRIPAATSMAIMERPASRRLINASPRDSRSGIALAVAPPIAASGKRLLGQLQHVRAAFGARREVLPCRIACQRAPALDRGRRQVRCRAAGALVDRRHFLIVGLRALD